MINEGGCAVPLHGIDGVIDYGMSLRDWLAGQALHAVAARWQGSVGDIDEAGAERTAVKAYMLADAMIMARSPQETGS